MDQEQTILDQTVIEDEQPKASLAEKLRVQKKARKKKLRKRIIIIAVVTFFSWLIYSLFKPYKQTAQYGICNTILQLLVPYPETIYVSEVKDQRDGSIRLWYTHTDAFGEYRMENFRCKVDTNPEIYPAVNGHMKIARITMRNDKIELSDAVLQNFDNMLPYFAANPLILNYPTALPDSLGALHFDFNAFRRFTIDSRKVN